MDRDAVPRIRLIAVLLTLTAITVACAGSNVRIDGTSPETTKRTLDTMAADLWSNQDRCLLHAAVLNIAINEKEKAEKQTGDKDAAPPPLGPIIGGKNAREILALSGTYPQRVTPLCHP